VSSRLGHILIIGVFSIRFPFSSPCRSFNRIRTLCHEEAEALFSVIQSGIDSMQDREFRQRVEAVRRQVTSVTSLRRPASPVEDPLTGDVDLMIGPMDGNLMASPESWDYYRSLTDPGSSRPGGPLGLLRPYDDLPDAPMQAAAHPACRYDVLLHLADRWSFELDRMLSRLCSTFSRAGRLQPDFPSDLRSLLLE
jgi:hypothetical protein